MGQLILVRHGQASFGADDYDVLSEAGWEQGRALGTWCRDTGVLPTALVRGDLRRHRETLEAVASTASWPLADVVVDADWNEFDHLPLVAEFRGAADGELDRRDFQNLFERATAAWTSGEHTGEFETYAEFVARGRGALVRATAAAGSGQTVVVVTSGGVIATVCAALLDPDGDDPVVVARLWSRFNTVIANASFTRVTVGSTGARLLTFNEHPHLTGVLRTYR